MYRNVLGRGFAKLSFSYAPFFSFFSSSSPPAPSKVKMIPVWEFTPTAVTNIRPEPSITWVPGDSVNRAVSHGETANNSRPLWPQHSWHSVWCHSRTSQTAVCQHPSLIHTWLDCYQRAKKQTQRTGLSLLSFSVNVVEL